MFYHSAPMVPGGQSLFGRMPWLDDKPDNFACSGHLSPNMQLIARPTTCTPSYVPLGRTVPRRTTAFPAQHFDCPDSRKIESTG